MPATGRALALIDNFWASCINCSSTLFRDFASCDGKYVRQNVNELAVDFGWLPVKGGGFYCRDHKPHWAG